LGLGLICPSWGIMLVKDSLAQVLLGNKPRAMRGMVEPQRKESIVKWVEDYYENYYDLW